MVMSIWKRLDQQTPICDLTFLANLPYFLSVLTSDAGTWAAHVRFAKCDIKLYRYRIPNNFFLYYYVKLKDFSAD